MYEEAQSSKYKFVNVRVGYAIRNKEDDTAKIIARVPKNERPKMKRRAVCLPEF
jgi:hypothetical protein